MSTTVIKPACTEADREKIKKELDEVIEKILIHLALREASKA